MQSQLLRGHCEDTQTTAEEALMPAATEREPHKPLGPKKVEQARSKSDTPVITAASRSFSANSSGRPDKRQTTSSASALLLNT